jgi:anti-sigma regulatory factor (Ser/Thr protein kinase)
MAHPRLEVLDGGGAGVDGTFRVSHEAASVPLARRALVRELDRCGAPGDAVDEVALVASELLGNAVRHAAPLGPDCVLLRWRVLPEAVQVEVVDGGGGPVRVTSAAPGATSGRGMHLVSQIADAWGTTDDGHGRRAVWASVATAPVRAAG